MRERFMRDEQGSALITALLLTVVMLGLGLALLSVVDTQASESGTDRSRDRAFNLAESVLTSEAFVLGRNWPDTQPAGNPACSAMNAGFSDAIDNSGAATPEVARLRNNLNASYDEDVYNGAGWQVNICDDGPADPTVWTSNLLTEEAYDQDADGQVWVRAQARVSNRTRVVAGLVRVVSSPALPSRYGLVTGGTTDDLGTTVNDLGSNALPGVLGELLSTTPTVAPDSTSPATSAATGYTGLRCGLLDMKANLNSTCVAGTIGALAAVPVVAALTGTKLEQFPTLTSATEADTHQLRHQAQLTNTYVASSQGGTKAAPLECQLTGATGSPSASTVVFIEKVGGGNDYCYVNVGAGVAYKALVIGSGNVVLRGNNTVTSPSAAPTNMFTGIVYALNLQRLSVANGGLGLGDAATPGREVIRIERGAHVKGGVYADGKSAKVGIYPPALTLNTNTLINTLVPCVNLILVTDCTVQNLVKTILTTLGLSAAVDKLIQLTNLTTVVAAINNQLRPQRASYGSAITSDIATVNRLTVYGASGIRSGTFRDLAGRTS